METRSKVGEDNKDEQMPMDADNHLSPTPIFKMTYIKLTCKECGDIIISNTKRHHEMNTCKCGKSGLDAEEEYSRMMGSYKFIEEYNYNFFDELVVCMKEQGFLKFVDLGDKRIYLNLIDVITIRKIEDELLESLKGYFIIKHKRRLKKHGKVR